MCLKPDSLPVYFGFVMDSLCGRQRGDESQISAVSEALVAVLRSAKTPDWVGDFFFVAAPACECSQPTARPQLSPSLFPAIMAGQGVPCTAVGCIADLCESTNWMYGEDANVAATRHGWC